MLMEDITEDLGGTVFVDRKTQHRKDNRSPQMDLFYELKLSSIIFYRYKQAKEPSPGKKEDGEEPVLS